MFLKTRIKAVPPEKGGGGCSAPPAAALGPAEPGGSCWHPGPESPAPPSGASAPFRAEPPRSAPFRPGDPPAASGLQRAAPPRPGSAPAADAASPQRVYFCNAPPCRSAGAAAPRQPAEWSCSGGSRGLGGAGGRGAARRGRRHLGPPWHSSAASDWQPRRPIARGHGRARPAPRRAGFRRAGQEEAGGAGACGGGGRYQGGGQRDRPGPFRSIPAPARPGRVLPPAPSGPARRLPRRSLGGRLPPAPGSGVCWRERPGGVAARRPGGGGAQLEPLGGRGAPAGAAVGGVGRAGLCCAVVPACPRGPAGRQLVAGWREGLGPGRPAALPGPSGRRRGALGAGSPGRGWGERQCELKNNCQVMQAGRAAGIPAPSCGAGGCFSSGDKELPRVCEVLSREVTRRGLLWHRAACGCLLGCWSSSPKISVSVELLAVKTCPWSCELWYEPTKEALGASGFLFK